MKDSTQGKAAKSATAGFTVIELVIAMTMVSAMALLFVPRIQDGLQGVALRGARGAVATQVARARSVAAGRGCMSTVHFTAGADPRVWVTSCPVTGNAAQIDTIGTVDAISSDAQVALSTTAPSITFSPTGTATAVSWTYVTFSQGEQRLQLSVSPIGKVTW